MDTYAGIGKTKDQGVALLDQALAHCRKRNELLEKATSPSWWRGALDFLGGAAIATGICAVYRR